MTRRTLVVAGLGAALTLACAPVPASAAPRFSCSRTVVTTTLELPDPLAPQGVRQVEVYRPPGPDSRRLPVVYLLHGFPGTDTDFADSGLVEQMDARLCAGQRFVAVVPDGSVPGNPDSEWADNPAGTFDLETFITTTLIHAVEGPDPRPAALRAIGGFSMGGFAAAAIAMRHRGTYRTVLSIAGYFHLDDPDHSLGMTVTAQSHHDPDVLLAAGRAAGMHVFLADGDNDTQPVVHGESQRYYADLHRHHVDAALTVVSGTHSLATFARSLPAALRFWKSRLPSSAG